MNKYLLLISDHKPIQEVLFGNHNGTYRKFSLYDQALQQQNSNNRTPRLITWRTRKRPVPERPTELRNSSLGTTVFSALAESSFGRFLTSWEMWSSENPWFLRTLRTESGPSRLSNCTLLEAERASFGDNPREFIRNANGSMNHQHFYSLEAVIAIFDKN
ncbi:hypothetical protein Prudu_008333 [Prunus dulcis]|uniref:Uncharacterized protein n=1 Tax=Prunus dulcis TaxID=3755 RepID=A0A4Y1R462_PRUDU|nr:hypothetical protein Prudu_008333 [Prunus dulcis]